MILSRKEIEKGLLRPQDFTIEILKEVDSTNSYLKKKAQECKEGTVVIADRQVSGRGRYDRKFYSPENCGVYMSILLKPKLSPMNSALLTAAAAVAAAKACEELSGKDTEIKWVNDIFIDNKKVSGILTEGAINPQTKMFDFAVLGIGINAYTPENGFDDGIKNIAGAVFSERKENLRNRLIACFLNNFSPIYESLEKRTFIKEYKNRLNCLNRDITVLNLGKNIKARAIDIDDGCRLLVEYKNGEREFLSSGEISIKL